MRLSGHACLLTMLLMSVTACRSLSETPAPTEATPTQAPIGQDSSADQVALATPTIRSTALPDPTPTQAPTEAPTTPLPPTYDPEALKLVARLNAWRVEQGLWPLRLNETLTALALAQAQYLASLPNTPQDFHLDAQGRQPPQRALAAGWPHYSQQGQVAIGENAYIGAGVEAALAYWQASDIHRRAALNPAFREIGAAAVPHSFGYLYIVTFGSRPDVLPALLDPLGGRLYLTSERYPYAGGGTWIHDVTHYQIVTSPDAAPDPAAWLPWQVAVAAPPTGGGQPFYVIYTDGQRQLTVEVRPILDVAWLPGNLPAEGALTAAHTPPPSVDPPQAPSGPPDLVVVYGNYSLTVIHPPPGDPRDISGLEFVGGQVHLPITRWNIPQLGAPLTAFPAGACLQTWPYGEGDPGVPFGCHLRVGVIYLQPEERFWTQADFEVHWQGAPLTTCALGAGRCEIWLP